MDDTQNPVANPATEEGVENTTPESTEETNTPSTEGSAENAAPEEGTSSAE